MGWHRQPRFDRTLRRWRTKVNGKIIYLGTSEDEAWDRFNKLGLGVGANLPASPENTVVELVEAWHRTHASAWRLRMLERWRDFERGRSVSSLRPDCLERFAAHLRETKFGRVGKGGKALPARAFSAKTIRHFVSAAAAVCKWAHDQGVLSFVPRYPKLAQAVRNPRDYSPAEIQQRFAKLKRNPPMLRLCQFALESGCRPSEARLLKWEHVDLKRRMAVISEHKTVGETGLPKIIYLTDAAIEVLGRVPGRHKGYVFLSGDGKPYTRHGMSSICKRYGIAPYRLRHTFAQAAREQDVNDGDLAALLGHTTTRMVQVYSQVRPERGVAVAKRIKPVG